MAGKSKTSKSRDNIKLHEEKVTPWKRGSALTMPPAKNGMDQRWIRFEMAGKYDATNLSRKLREGWSPVKQESVSDEFKLLHGEAGKISGLIVQGMILCERPLKISKQRSDAMNAETQVRTEALNHDLDRVNQVTKNPHFGGIEKQMRHSTSDSQGREVPNRTD